MQLFVGAICDAEYDMVRSEEQRPEAKQESIKCQKMGCTLPRTIDFQELLLYEKAVSDYGFRTTRSHEFGDSGEQMDGRHDQIFYGEAE